MGRAGGRLEVVHVSSGAKVAALTDAKAPTKHGDRWVGIEMPRWAPDRAVGWYTTGRGIVCTIGDNSDYMDLQEAATTTTTATAAVVKEFALPVSPIGAFRLHPSAPQAGKDTFLFNS